MKIYLLVLFLMLILSGCKSISTQDAEFYDEVQRYMDSNGYKCLKYVENDKTLINRDKQPFFARHYTLQKLLNEMKNR